MVNLIKLNGNSFELPFFFVYLRKLFYMRDTLMHQHLSEKELRDFFSQELSKTIHFKIPSTPTDYNLRGIDAYIKKLEIDLADTELTLHNMKKQKSLMTLMEMKGWKDFDVSDEIGRSSEHYLNFIGTQVEYEALMLEVKNEG